MTPKVLKGKLKADRPTAKDKELEAGMAAELSKEDFYGKKKTAPDMKVPPFMDKIGRDALNKQRVEAITKKMRQAPKGVIFRSITVQKKP